MNLVNCTFGFTGFVNCPLFYLVFFSPFGIFQNGGFVDFFFFTVDKGSLSVCANG